jgi:hypothetical protein
MEERFADATDPGVRELFSLYQAVLPRFEADLAGFTRDIALAKASALMLVQTLADDRRGS